MDAPTPVMQCLVCDKKFSTASGLKRHLRRHAGKPHMCPSCKKSFCRKDELRAHMRTHDPTDEGQFMCHECGMKLKSKSSLHNHTSMVHKHKTFQCSLCAKVFSSKYAQERHERGHGPKEECERCKKQVKRLEDHKRICSSERKRKFKCDVCGNTFLQRKYLKEHEKYKHGAERYQCTRCAHLFTHRKSLCQHKLKCSK